MKKPAAILFLIILGSSLFAARIQFSHISVEEGLSQSNIACIFQDSTGFMWFGTTDGLNRYDGKKFKVFQHHPHDPRSLTSDNISAICEDKAGKLWFGTGNGLNEYDPRTEQFTNYKHNSDDLQSLGGNIVKTLYADESGIVWIGTYSGGLDKYDPRTREFTRYKFDKKLSANRVYKICGGQPGTIWLGTGGYGVSKFDIEKEKFTIYKHIPGNPNSVADDYINAIFFDRETDTLWVGSGKGLDKFDIETEEFTHFKHDPKRPDGLADGYVKSLLIDSHDVLWIGTPNGLNKYNLRTEEFAFFRHEPNDPSSLSHNRVFSIYEDRSGALWFGTGGEGLNVYDRKLHKFLYYQHNPNDSNSLSQNKVYAIFEDRSGHIWLGTTRGLNRFDPKTEGFTHYLADPRDPHSLTHNTIFSICGSRSGKLWVGTAYGLNEFDPQTGKALQYRWDRQTNFSPHSIGHVVVLDLHEDRSGMLWIGTRRSLDKFDPEKKVFTHYQYSLSSEFLINPSNEVNVIYGDSSGILWLGTSGGLFKFNPEKEEFIAFTNNPDNPETLGYNVVNTILEDRWGTLWIGTEGGGLDNFNPGTGTFSHYTDKNGLPNNNIKGILEDNKGNLWISTAKGLSRFNHETGTFRNYSQKAGLQGYEFNEGSCFFSKTGEMYFGGMKGFNRFYPGGIEDNLHLPPIVITRFIIPDIGGGANGDLPLQKEVSLSEEIVLSHTDNIFSIEFAALDYTDPGKNQYKCMLEGFSNDWINLGYKNDITFTNLDSGNYTFRVKGSNNDGIWNRDGASLKIVILPPFWHTWWFRFFLAAFVSGFLFFLHKLRTTRIKQDLEKKRLEKELRLKADFTAMLVHDLRSPLTAIIGYSDMLNEMPEQMDVKKTGQVIHRSSEKMLSLINDMLELSKFEAGKMALEIKEVDISATVIEIVEIMTPLFKKKEINLVCDFDPATGKSKLAIDLEKIGQVITNFLSNAAKFTPQQGTVFIKILKMTGGRIEVSVSDNGPGIPQDKQEFLFDKYVQFNKGLKTKGTGLGLAVSKLIVDSHGGAIGYRHGDLGVGSTFYFRLPIKA